MKEYYIAHEGSRKGPFSFSELENQVFYSDTLIWKEGWDDWKKASQVPDLEPFINATPPPIKEQSSKKNDGKGISLIERAYQSAGRSIDRLLEKNKDKIETNTFFGVLHKVRTYYKTLSESRQRGVSFFLSTILFFLLASSLANNWLYGYYFTTYWVAFIALNQFKGIGQFISSITQLVIGLFLMILPGIIGEAIGLFVSSLGLLLIAYLFGWIIAPIYIIYRVIILVLNLDDSSKVAANI